ncbi:unnamed protein product, partial [Rotaria sordida]
KYLLYEKELQSIESLSLIQAKQLIDIVHYLYDSRIIHRDVCPQNLMLDRDTNQIKLIDFGFAIACNMDNKGGSIRIIGPFAYATQSFLKFYLKLLAGQMFPYYFYEPTFDLISALNIIMMMSNADIKRSIDSLKKSQDVKELVSKSLQLWKDIQCTNKRYSNLLNLINKLNSGYSLDYSDESSVDDVSKDESDESPVGDVAKDESDELPVSDVSKDELIESDELSFGDVSKDKSDELPVGDVSKDKSIESDESSVGDVSNNESIESDEPSISTVLKDPSAIFDIIKDEIEKLFDI